MLGKLAGTGYIDHNTGELFVGIEGEHQIQEMIRTGLIACKPVVIGLAVHDCVTVGGNGGLSLFGVVVHIGGTTGMCHHRIAVAVCHGCICPAVPGLYNGSGTLICEELSVLRTGIDLLAVRRGGGSLCYTATGVGMCSAHNDFFHRDFGAKLCHLFPCHVDDTVAKHHQIHGAKDHDIFPVIHTHGGGIQRVMHTLGNTHIHLSGHGNRLVAGQLLLTPTDLQITHFTLSQFLICSHSFRQFAFWSELRINTR